MSARWATSIVGFDSAWTNNPNAPGAICIFRSRDNTNWSAETPRLASFELALEAIIQEERLANRRLVAIDQPTIVPNPSGARPVDRVAASLISFVGGGVQPANRSKQRMFDDGAPIWKFKADLSPVENPELARTAKEGTFLIEVFPALALPSLDDAFHGRLRAPRYNPARRKTYKQEHWLNVVDCVAAFGRRRAVVGLDDWLASLVVEHVQKAQQDMLDAVLCALIGLNWLDTDRGNSIMIGDLEFGYMIAPATTEVRGRLEAAAGRLGVRVDGALVADRRS